MQGKRVQDNSPKHLMKQGEYGRTLLDGEWTWYCRVPKNGIVLGNLGNHKVVEHDDGTITVSPSILIKGGQDMEQELWHGYLEKGIWREC